MRQGKAQMPKKPVVVGDRLFTNTSKRWISTANLREDVFMVRRFNHIDTEKRSAQQEHDYLMKSFRELWDRKLDKNRLTKVPEAKREESRKKEVAAYLRDVYSDTSSMGFDMSATMDLLQSMSRRPKKKGKKVKKITDIEEGSERDDGGGTDEDEEGGEEVAGVSTTSLPGVGKYLPEDGQEIQEEAHGRLKSLRRPIKSAGDVKPPVVRPLLSQKSKSFSKIPDPDFRVLSPELEHAVLEHAEFNMPSEGQAKESTDQDRDLHSANPAPHPAGGGEDVQSSHGSSLFSSENILLDKLSLVPRALPPIYQTKTRKPVVRPWDYPMAGSVRTPPDRLDRDPNRAEITFSDQSVDLKHCRYLRLAPNKHSKKKQEKPKRKEQFILVVAGRAGPDMLSVHPN